MKEKPLDELMFMIRQHPAFPELLKAIECPDPLRYSPSKSGAVAEQQAEWIYRSGRRAQDILWRSFLTETASSEA